MASSIGGESDEEPDHQLLIMPSSDSAFSKDKPLRLAREMM